MDARLFEELGEVFESLDRDHAVRVVILTGPGKDFSLGLDLKSAGDLLISLAEAGDTDARQDFLELLHGWQDAITAVASCRKPTIACIAGWCVGAGVDLAAACDIRIASSDSVFSVREVRVGIVADLGSLQRLAGVIGDGHLRELALTGGDISASRAASIGLVNHVMDGAENAMVAAAATAARIAQNSPLALRGIKEILNAEREPRVAAGLRYTAAWNAAFIFSEDLREAMQAFTEGRDPVFSGR
ncbi:enoyl-CoA hydratase [Nocardioides panzhihuensis]|uniref:Enoyl-CoA hydratase n=2 Tax=Nocardioides panzhihuensis TaxID=860243 RepID=A0A7Z0IRI6_9ACTN|nr:enoyl-CoA hydratase [Nocardioides panzhihuensis]